MNIALDFDETFTTDPELWAEFIDLAKHRGHEVTFVTYRDHRWDVDDIMQVASELDISVIFTAGKQKSTAFKADVWIDDDPVTIPSAPQLGDMYDGCLINNDMSDEL